MSRLFDEMDVSSTKYKIVEAALDLFSRKGYSAVSVRELTKVVGIKESSLYNHFKSKEEILEYIYDLFQKERSRSMPGTEVLSVIAANYSVEGFLREGIDMYKKSVANDHYEKMWRILNIEQFRDERARKLILEEMYDGTISFLEKAFQAFMNVGKIPQQDARSLAIRYQYPVFTMMTEYLLLKYDELDTTDVEQKMHDHVDYILKSIE
jgi:AcrR family transcriptional regulator